MRSTIIVTSTPYAGKHRRAFVSRAGRELRLDGSVFRFVGFNVPQLLSLAAGQTPEQAAHMAEVLMHSAAGLGLKVARVWAFRDGWDWRPPHYRQYVVCRGLAVKYALT